MSGGVNGEDATAVVFVERDWRETFFMIGVNQRTARRSVHAYRFSVKEATDLRDLLTRALDAAPSLPSPEETTHEG
jgi:hypothetical protein